MKNGRYKIADAQFGSNALIVSDMSSPGAVTQNYLPHFRPYRTEADILLGVQTWLVCGAHNLIPPIYVVGFTWTFFGFFLRTFWVFFICPPCIIQPSYSRNKKRLSGLTISQISLFCHISGWVASERIGETKGETGKKGRKWCTWNRFSG